MVVVLSKALQLAEQRLVAPSLQHGGGEGGGGSRGKHLIKCMHPQKKKKKKSQGTKAADLRAKLLAMSFSATGFLTREIQNISKCKAQGQCRLTWDRTNWLCMGAIPLLCSMHSVVLDSVPCYYRKYN